MTQDTREAMELLLVNRLYLYSLFHKLIGRDPDGELLSLLSAAYDDLKKTIITGKTARGWEESTFLPSPSFES